MNMTLPLDEQGRPIVDPTLGAVVEKVMTFDGATENDPGDQSGTGNPAKLFDVEGTVKLRLLAICETTLTSGGAPTIEAGVAGDIAALIAQTLALDIDVNEIWHDATPDSKVELLSVLEEQIVSDDVIQTIGVADITAGVIRYIALWYPLSDNAKVS